LWELGLGDEAGSGLKCDWEGMVGGGILLDVDAVPACTVAGVGFGRVNGTQKDDE